MAEELNTISPPESRPPAARIGIWPGWILVVFSLVFTFVVPALMIVRRIWQAHKRAAAVYIGFFSMIFYGAYIYGIFAASLFWLHSLLLQIGVSLSAGFVLIVLQRLILGGMFPHHRTVIPWKRMGLFLFPRSWWANFVAAFFIFYASALTLVALGWMAAKIFAKVYAPLPGWIFLWPLASVIPAAVFTSFTLNRHPAGIPAKNVVGFFAGGILIFGLSAGLLFIIVRLIPDYDFLTNARVMKSWRAGNLFEIYNYGILSLIALGGMFFLSNSSGVRNFLGRGTMVLFGIVFVIINLFAYDSSFAHLYYYLGLKNAREVEAGSLLRANRHLKRYLRVFPETPKKGEIVDLLVRHYRELGQIEECIQILRQFLTTSKGDWRYAFHLGEAEKKLNSLEKWTGEEGVAIEDLPVIEKEDYLGNNWSGLLSVLRFWDRETSREKFKMQLQKISLSEEKIQLPWLTQFVQIKECVRRLGYRTYLLRADPEQLKQILEEGIPVLAGIWAGFVPVFAFDPATESFRYYRYAQQTKKRLSGQAIYETIYVEKSPEGEEESFLKDRKEVLAELTQDRFKNDWRQHEYILALIFPESTAEDYLRQLGFDPEVIGRQSRALTLFSLGELCAQREDFNGAVGYYYDALEVYPEFRFIEQYLGVSYLRLNRIETDPRLRERFGVDYDRQHFRDWLARTGAGERLKQTAADVTRMVENNAQELSYKIIWRYILSLNKDYPEHRPRIARAWRELLELYPDNAGNRIGLGEIYEREDNWTEMIELYKYLISQEPLLSKHRIKLARAYAARGDFAGVKKQLAEINWFERDRYADYFYLRGRCYLETGRFRRAESALRRAVKMDKFDADYHFYWAQALKESGKFDQAEKALEWVMLLEGKDPMMAEASALLEELRKRQDG